MGHTSKLLVALACSSSSGAMPPGIIIVVLKQLQSFHSQTAQPSPSAQATWRLRAASGFLLLKSTRFSEHSLLASHSHLGFGGLFFLLAILGPANNSFKADGYAAA
jgi:hypothetical protein